MNINGHAFARLVYLLTELKVRLPKPLLTVLPGSEWIAELHLGGAASDIPLERFQNLYTQGASMGPGSIDELRILITRILQTNVDADALGPKKILAIYQALVEMAPGSTMLLEPEELDLAAWQSNPGVDEELVKWQSGFAPFDKLIDGFYQGLMVIMAKPGVGKTSLMLSLCEALIQNEIVDSVLFVENELPLTMMKYKMRPMLRRTKFRPTDRLICASWSAGQIMQWIQENPNQNRAVFYDSPDIGVSSDPEMRRFTLEQAYQQLIAIKQVSRIVVTSSQPNRKTANDPSMEGTAESWAKAWYADMMIGLSSSSLAGEDGSNRLRGRTLKNRFGVSGTEVSFQYNYQTMTASEVADPLLDF